MKDQAIPRAIVNSVRGAVRRFGRLTLRAGIVTAMCGGAYGISQAGCRNDAITYAHTVYGEDTHCSAIQTCTGGGRPDCKDSAVCRLRDGRSVVCSSSNDTAPSCKDVTP